MLFEYSRSISKRLAAVDRFGELRLASSTTNSNAVIRRREAFRRYRIRIADVFVPLPFKIFFAAPNKAGLAAAR
jgi:hypothetical protein